jgi:hypothetical protein
VRDAPGRRAKSGFGTGGGFGGGEPGYFGDSPEDSITLDEAARSVELGAGRSANLIARKNAQLREMRSKDEGRLDLSRLPIQKLGGRWYHRIGGFLVDEDVNEQTTITTVKFGSDAYFGLIQGRRDLREALAASRNVIVMVGAGQAVLVADDEGIEEFSPEQMKQFGLVGR